MSAQPSCPENLFARTAVPVYLRVREATAGGGATTGDCGEVTTSGVAGSAAADRATGARFGATPSTGREGSESGGRSAKVDTSRPTTTRAAGKAAAVAAPTVRIAAATSTTTRARSDLFGGELRRAV